jgi:predicted RNA methylase
MSIQLDQYFTPEKIASSLLEQADLIEPNVCIDPTCGLGNLLTAATSIYTNIKCVGIDKDKNVIYKLRKKNPNWTLSVADMLNSNSYLKTSAFLQLEVCDALLLNPPFSQVKSKHVDISYRDKSIKGSVAMSYIMKSLELFSPTQGALIIAPESLLHSQVDEYARLLLENEFDFQSICDLESKTFKGARVHAHVFKLNPRTSSKQIIPIITSSENVVNANLVRGGLQVHKFNQTNTIDRHSVPFLHTTTLSNVVNNKMRNCSQTSLHASGRIKGNIILLPRVGQPKKENTKAQHLSTEVQLSDCVFAIESECLNSLKQIEYRLHNNWDEFRNIYRGTGARYVTIAKLISWFVRHKIHLNHHK